MTKTAAILFPYYGVLAALAFYGVHRFRMIVRHYRGAKSDPEPPPVPAGDAILAAPVLVQLPVYNERFVVERLLHAAASLRWSGPVRIQLLDDSTDETADVAARVTFELRRAGHDVTHIRRGTRDGYKAGALSEGLRIDAAHPEGPAPYVAIFDADFVPPEGFLLRTMPHLHDPCVALVQARWEHLNRDESLLTELQAIFLDGHFALESAVRFRSGLFFNFNGTAGVFRRAAIESAGGWSGDTLTEDLDLSYRVLLRGWRFVFLSDVTAPAELPGSMRDFRSQQARWTKGSIEVARKLLSRILAAPLPRPVRLEAFVHLTNNLSYPLVVLLALLVVPSIVVRHELRLLSTLFIDAPLFLASSLSVALFYLVSQRVLGRPWKRKIRFLPMTMSLGIGMAVENAVGVIEALLGSSTPFLRTPKKGRAGVAAARFYRRAPRLVVGAEIALLAYFALALFWCVTAKAWAALPFLLVFFSGFFYGVLFTLISWPGSRSAPSAPAPEALRPTP